MEGVQYLAEDHKGGAWRDINASGGMNTGMARDAGVGCPWATVPCLKVWAGLSGILYLYVNTMAVCDQREMLRGIGV